MGVTNASVRSQPAFYSAAPIRRSPILRARLPFVEHHPCHFMRRSFPVDDGTGQVHHRDRREPYDNLEFLQDRLPEVFQEKIGLSVSGRAKMEVALLGAIHLLNRYHFAKVGLPVKGALQLTYRDSPGDALRKAEDNRADLILKLIEFQDYLSRDTTCFHEATTAVGRYLQMLGHSVTDKKTKGQQKDG
jgi:hypothetical protein